MAELADGMKNEICAGKGRVPRSNGRSFLSRGKLVGVVLYTWLESLRSFMA